MDDSQKGGGSQSLGYLVLVAFLTTLATGIAAAVVSKVTDGSVARLFGGLTYPQFVKSVRTETSDGEPGKPPAATHKCKEDRLLLSCYTYVSSGATLCDSSIQEDGAGGTCRVGTCNAVPNQFWRTVLTCMQR
jgi:hypothetical protein